MRYIYVDSEDEYPVRFLRIDVFDILPDIKKWLLSKRPRTLIAADNYVKGWYPEGDPYDYHELRDDDTDS